MSYEMFIIPITLITVEIIKKFDVPTKWLAIIACLVGAVFGGIWAAVQGETLLALDWLGFITRGLIYGAAAAGIYDVSKAGETDI